MSRLRTLCVALFAIFALSAMATAVASAEEGFLPSTKQGFTFKATSEKQVLETEKKSKITCTSLTGGGLLISDKHAEKVSFDFDGCKSQGFAAQSLGDEEGSGLILINEALALVCLLSGGGFGMIVELNKELHLEAGGVLILVSGSVIGALTPVGTEPTEEFTGTFTQTGAGKQSITSCADKSNHKLEAKFGSGALEPASEVATGTLKGEEPKELMDT